MKTMLSGVMTMFRGVQNQEATVTRIPSIEIAPEDMTPEMKELHRMLDPVLAVAVKKMLGGRYFSICDLDGILAVVGAVPNGDTYRMLRTLHCVNWMDMPPEVRAWVKKVTLQMCGAQNPQPPK